MVHNLPENFNISDFDVFHSALLPTPNCIYATYGDNVFPNMVAGSKGWFNIMGWNFLILADVDPAALDQGMKVYRSAPRLNTSFRDLNCKLYYAAWFLLHPLPWTIFLKHKKYKA